MMTAKQRHEQIRAYIDQREALWEVSDAELAESAAMAEHDPFAEIPAPTTTLDFLRKHTLAPL